MPGNPKPRHKFPKGNKFGGRKKGSRDKFSNQFIEDFHDSWVEGGKAVIEKVMKEDPSTYLRVAAGLLPKDFNINVSEFAEMSDEQLDRLCAELDRAIAVARGGDPAGQGEEGQARPPTTH